MHNVLDTMLPDPQNEWPISGPVSDTKASDSLMFGARYQNPGT
jgi:hypothetical protein